MYFIVVKFTCFIHMNLFLHFLYLNKDGERRENFIENEIEHHHRLSRKTSPAGLKFITNFKITLKLHRTSTVIFINYCTEHLTMMTFSLVMKKKTQQTIGLDV